jgi:hypothetical protein
MRSPVAIGPKAALLTRDHWTPPSEIQAAAPASSLPTATPLPDGSNANSDTVPAVAPATIQVSPSSAQNPTLAASVAGSSTYAASTNRTPDQATAWKAVTCSNGAPIGGNVGSMDGQEEGESSGLGVAVGSAVGVGVGIIVGPGEDAVGTAGVGATGVPRAAGARVTSGVTVTAGLPATAHAAMDADTTRAAAPIKARRMSPSRDALFKGPIPV